MWNPSKLFNKKFREKAHPEVKILEEITWLNKKNYAHFQDTMNCFKGIREDIIELTKKIDIIFDIKNLKERVEKL